MSFQAHKDEILKFYESTNSFVHEHQQLFGKLVTRLNQKKSATQSLNGNLDDFMAHSFKEFNQYRTKIQSQNLDDSLVTYTYDTNKEEYLNSFSLPDKKIIVKHKFKLVRMGGVKVEHKLRGGPWSSMFYDDFDSHYSGIGGIHNDVQYSIVCIRIDNCSWALD